MDYRIPLKKQSKRAKREYYSKQRKVWSVSPVTRVKPNKKKESALHEARSLMNDENAKTYSYEEAIKELNS